MRELLMQMPMRADLVSARDDGLHHARMMLGDVAWHEERGRDLQMIEQAEQSRHTHGRSILALRHGGQSRSQLRVLGERGRLTIDVKAQHEGALGSIGPDEARRWGERSHWSVVIGHWFREAVR